MPTIAGHRITDRQLVALHGLYRGLVQYANGRATVYGVNVKRQLDALADAGIIARTVGSHMIPYDSPGEAVIAASPDFVISAHL